MTRAHGDTGTAAVEGGLAVTALLLVGLFIIGALRLTNSGSDVRAAARSAARAAAAEYDPAAASNAAQAVAAGSLDDRGVACRNLTVAVNGGLTAGSTVIVDVTCTVDLSDVTITGLPGSRTMTGRAVELVDLVRGGN